MLFNALKDTSDGTLYLLTLSMDFSWCNTDVNAISLCKNIKSLNLLIAIDQDS